MPAVLEKITGKNVQAAIREEPSESVSQQHLQQTAHVQPLAGGHREAQKILLLSRRVRNFSAIADFAPSFIIHIPTAEQSQQA